MDQNQDAENRNSERDAFKKRVHEGVDWLKQIEDRARNFANQNLADIAAAARGRLQQLRDHPDLDLLHDDKMRDRVERLDDRVEYKDPHPSTAMPANGASRQPLPFDPKAGMNATPGSEIGGPDRGKPDTHVPGEYRFDSPNKNFQQPNAVDLNNDGTLRQAPNSVGAKSDVREGA